MSGYGMHVLAMLALQHLWQVAMLLGMVWLVLRWQPRFSARMRSRIWLCALVLAAVLPLAVLLPRDASTVSAGAVMASAQAPAAPVVSGLRAAAHVTSMPASAVSTDWRADVGVVLLGIWLLGFGWGLWRLLAGWRGARGLYRESVRPHDLVSKLPRVRLHGANVRVSDQISSPMVIGVSRPCVLLPRELFDHASPDTLTHVLNHELAHVQRGDLWVAWMQALSLAVYWWSPLLRLISARLDIDREMACDERASIQSGNAIDYANALLASTRSALLHPSSRRTLAVGIFESRAALTRRMEALLNMNIGQSIDGKKAMLIASSGMLFLSMSLTLLATPRLGPALPTEHVSADASHAGDAALLIDAVVAKQRETIRALVARGVDVNASQVGDGTALIVAAKRGDLDIVGDLIKLGADVNMPSPGDGNPLIAASAHDHVEVAKLLVEAGAQVNAIVAGDETPLINAARAGDLALVHYLVDQGADVNLGVVADWGKWRSPLNQAANAQVKDYLRSKGATPHQP